MVESKIPFWVPWVFSGIGVAVIGWFGKWLYKRFRRNNAPPSSQVNISGSHIEGPVAGRDVNIGTYVNSESSILEYDKYPDTPTPADIRAAINRASLYLRESVGESFVGIKVRWRLKLESIVARGSKIGVTLHSPSGLGAFVVTDVSVEDYPVLKTVHGGEAVEIAGTIEYVQYNSMIHMKNVRLRFL